MKRIAWLIVPALLATNPSIARAAPVPDDDQRAVELYKPSYIGWRMADEEKPELKFRFSIKINLAGHLWGAYSQKSFWQIREPSAPFREHNFNPESFFLWEDDDWLIGVLDSRILPIQRIQFGIEHESTGVAAGESRDWNRIYTDLRIAYSFRSNVEIRLYPKLWWVYHKGAENDDIIDTTGFGTRLGSPEADAIGGQLVVIALYRDWWRFAVERGASYTMLEANQRLWHWQNFHLYAQYFNGRGEGLITFKEHSESVTVGISLVKR